MPPRPRLLSVFTTTLLLSLVVHLPLGTRSGMDAAIAKPASSEERKAEADRLNQDGLQFLGQEQFREALKTFQQALAIRIEIGDRAGEGQTLNNIGSVHRNLGQYPQALDYYQQALAILTEVGDRADEGITLNNIGFVSDNLGQYPQALDYYQQALAIRKEIGDRAGEGQTLNNIGSVYWNLGQYPQALDYYQQALAIRKEIGDRAGEGVTLNNIGSVHRNLGQYPQALDYYQQALAIATEVGDRAGEGVTLNNIGFVHRNLGQYSQALDYYQQALAILTEVGDRAGEGVTLNNVGFMYWKLGQYSQALDYFQQALAILTEVGDRAGEGGSLNNIGSLLEAQNQPELAIVFFKQSVNRYETIRDSNRTLTEALQNSYTATVADTYRNLADLLLEQGRILEAQQVLELLKVEELREYTEERSILTTDGIQLTEIEQRIVQDHDSLVAFGQRVEECQQIQCSELNQLLEQRELLTQQFNQIVQTFETEVRNRLAQDRAVLDTQDFSRAAREIVDAQPGTVLIYPFVLEDKLWLLWATSGGVVNSIEVPVTQQQLGEVVLQFRQLLDDPTSDLAQVQATAQRLHDWLIAPLQSELESNQIQHLVFSLDRVTRYIPIAALFDGEQYLIERYTVSTILSADLTNVRDRLSPGTENNPILALGLSEAVPPDFNALTHVPDELDAIVRENANDPHGIYPGLQFLNGEFDQPTLRNNLYGHRILHIATHAVFQSGRQDQSYLLLGTGDPFKIADIQNLQDLGELQLVILSACETALGAPDQDGIEIPGIAFNFLNGGADTVIASLWAVADVSTANLMQQFYQRLGAATTAVPITRAEALRQAQLSLLHGEDQTEADPSQRGIVELRVSPDGSVPAAESDRPSFSHPYYWAPFILIGNGL